MVGLGEVREFFLRNADVSIVFGENVSNLPVKCFNSLHNLMSYMIFDQSPSEFLVQVFTLEATLENQLLFIQSGFTRLL